VAGRPPTCDRSRGGHWRWRVRRPSRIMYELKLLLPPHTPRTLFWLACTSLRSHTLPLLRARSTRSAPVRLRGHRHLSATPPLPPPAAAAAVRRLLPLAVDAPNLTAHVCKRASPPPVAALLRLQAAFVNPGQCLSPVSRPSPVSPPPPAGEPLVVTRDTLSLLDDADLPLGDPRTLPRRRRRSGSSLDCKSSAATMRNPFRPH